MEDKDSTDNAETRPKSVVKGLSSIVILAGCFTFLRSRTVHSIHYGKRPANSNVYGRRVIASIDYGRSG